MTINEVVTRVNGKIAVNKTDAEVSSAYASDLLSDVMGHCGDESALITIQNHLNTIAVCTLVGIEIIIICLNILNHSIKNKKKPANQLFTGFFWRRRRDSNPRCAINAYTSSSRAP